MSEAEEGDELTTKIKSENREWTRSKPYSKPGPSNIYHNEDSNEGEFVSIPLPIPFDQIKAEPEFEEVFVPEPDPEDPEPDPEAEPEDIKDEPGDTSEPLENEQTHKSPYNTRTKCIKKQSDSNINQSSSDVTVKLSNYNGIRCIPCGKYIRSHTELLEHFKSVNHEKLNCLRCHRKGFDIRSLISHLQSVHAIKNHHTEVLFNMKNVLIFGVNCYSNFEFTCMFCDNMKYQTIENLREHLNRSHNYCMACGVALKRQGDFIVHKYKHAQGEILFYKCLVCKLVLKTSRHFVNHSLKFHKSNVSHERVAKEETILSKKYDCPYCDVPTTHPQLLINHMELHKVYNCELCDNKFAILETKNSFIPKNCTICELSNGDVPMDPLSTTERQPKTPSYLQSKKPTGMSNLPCLFCEAYRGSSKEIYNHLSESHYMCRVCILSFENDYQFNTHQHDHEIGNIKFYQCTLDLRVFKDINELDEHLKNIHRFSINTGRTNKYYKIVNKVIPELHMDRILDNTQCPYCHAFVSMSSMMSHLSFAHNIMECIKCTSKVIIQNKLENTSKICRYCIKGIPLPKSVSEKNSEGVCTETQTPSNFNSQSNLRVDSSLLDASQVFDNVIVKLEEGEEPLDLLETDLLSESQEDDEDLNEEC